MILVGTSGFQYRDWVPVFYPRDLDTRSWLRYYSQRFGCGELCFRPTESRKYWRFKKLSKKPEVLYRLSFALLPGFRRSIRTIPVLPAGLPQRYGL